MNKSDSRCAVVRFCYHSYDYRPNWTPLRPIKILIDIDQNENEQELKYDLTKIIEKYLGNESNNAG